MCGHVKPKTYAADQLSEPETAQFDVSQRNYNWFESLGWGILLAPDGNHSCTYIAVRVPSGEHVEGGVVGVDEPVVQGDMTCSPYVERESMWSGL